jgi:tetratricopeptide (TPR) repeat protein
MLRRNPDDAHLNFALGNVFAQQGKWKPAQQSYFNAWQRDNGNADYLFNLAVSMDQLGKQKQAVEFYQDCLTKSANKQVAFSREAVRKRITELSRL